MPVPNDSRSPRRPLDRRQFLHRGLAFSAGAVALGAGGSTLLSACGSSSSSSGSDASPSGSASAAADYGQLTYQLSWIKNVEFAGPYLADKNGYYTDAGFSSVNLAVRWPDRRTGRHHCLRQGADRHLLA